MLLSEDLCFAEQCHACRNLLGMKMWWKAMRRHQNILWVQYNTLLIILMHYKGELLSLDYFSIRMKALQSFQMSGTICPLTWPNTSEGWSLHACHNFLLVWIRNSCLNKFVYLTYKLYTGSLKMIDLISRCNNFYGLVGTCSSVGKVFLNVHIFLCMHHARVLYTFQV